MTGAFSVKPWPAQATSAQQPKQCLSKLKAKKQTQLTETSLTITEVRRAFEAIAQTSGSGSRTKKERLITALLSQATPVEAKYLVKIFTGEMRTGLHEGLMEQAVAKAFDVSVQKVQHASMVLGDIGEVAATLKTHGVEGLENAGFSVFRPVKLMLAQTAQTVKEALAEQAKAKLLLNTSTTGQGFRFTSKTESADFQPKTNQRDRKPARNS